MVVRSLPTLVSEQTPKARMSSSHWAVHSRNDWLSKEIDGTRNRMRALPPASVAICSAIFNAVNVFPVPQAMISLPRSLPAANPASTFSMASAWCGRGCFLAAGESSMVRLPCGQAMSQSMGDSASISIPMRCTGICCPLRASSAFLPHLSVVEMITRLVKPVLPDAVKNVSISPLARWCCGS